MTCPRDEGRARCIECDRPMRTAYQPKAPGTVVKGHGGKCKACYMRARRPAPLPPVEKGRTSCDRCGGESNRPLCRDCRDVMSKEEVAAWAV